MSVALTKNYKRKESRTKRLNKDLVRDTDTGRDYELRYDPESGTAALVGFTDSSDSGDVLFQSTPSGGKFTAEGKDLINAGTLRFVKKDGSLESGTASGKDIRQAISESTETAYNRELRRIRSQSKDAKRGTGTGTGDSPVPIPVVRATDTTTGGPGEKGATVAVTDPTVTEEETGITQRTNSGSDSSSETAPDQESPDAKKGNNEFDKAQKILEQTRDFLLDNTLSQATFDDNRLREIRNSFKASDKSLKAIAKGGLRYPSDAIYSGGFAQDHVQIIQYTYRPPNKDLIFNKDPGKLLTNGNLRRSPLEDLIGYVKLPMPNNITDSNAVSWGSDAMNNLSAAITSAVTKNPLAVGGAALGGSILGNIAGISGAGGAAALAAILLNNKEAVGNVLTNPNSQVLIGGAAASKILNAAGINVSPEALLARGIGVVPNSNMELLFDAPTLRKFEFSWQLAARDPAEALEIKRIIRFFKQGMAVKTMASQAGGATILLGTPNIFKLRYKTANEDQIEGVNRVKECAVTGVSVNYTPEGKWAAYDAGQPVSYTLSLRMEELEPIYASDYIDGAAAVDSAGDSVRGPGYSPVTGQEVGY